MIVREGEVGDAFYFVKEGRLEVSKKTKDGQDAMISVLGDGQGFGEMALLSCAVRAGSVKTVTSSVLYCLHRDDFDQVVLEDAVFKDNLIRQTAERTQYNRIKILQPFALLEPARMSAVMQKMEDRICVAGENIITQGERGDTYYIINTGTVGVLKTNKRTGETVRTAVLGPGDAFGEEALIRDDPRNATCRALEKTSLLVLHKKDFDTIVKPSFLDFIFPEELDLDTCMKEFIFIDARITAEYEEEHIAGAINIPVEILRNKCRDFDQGKKYITHCLNNSRGMVAAFLLKNRGFDAICLRGGVGGWLAGRGGHQLGWDSPADGQMNQEAEGAHEQ